MEMADYVLVHGGNMSVETWNRLTTGDPVCTEDGTMGGKIWDGTVTVLQKHGHRAFAPTLADEHSSTLTEHIGRICGLITGNDLQDVILVGHSYGGIVITGVADRITERIGRLVYVDAALPDPGQSLFDIIVSAGIDPMSFSGLEPAPPYVEKLHFDAAKIERLQKTYIRCTHSDFTAVTNVARKKIAAAKKGWKYYELPASHVPMADMPDEFLGLLLDAAIE
jgi:pimeloyl-ACP methyl ester carboxylesterase